MVGQTLSKKRFIRPGIILVAQITPITMPDTPHHSSIKRRPLVFFCSRSVFSFL